MQRKWVTGPKTFYFPCNQQPPEIDRVELSSLALILKQEEKLLASNFPLMLSPRGDIVPGVLNGNPNRKHGWAVVNAS